VLHLTAHSRFEVLATNIGAQATVHAFACLDAMTVQLLMLRPDKALNNLIRETGKPENLTVTQYANRLQALNNHLTLLQGNITPLSTSAICDTIKENVAVQWQNKYENADLNLESIAELTGCFTRLESLISRGISPPLKLLVG
jgi:hypothetical protein